MKRKPLTVKRVLVRLECLKDYLREKSKNCQQLHNNEMALGFATAAYHIEDLIFKIKARR